MKKQLTVGAAGVVLGALITLLYLRGPNAILHPFNSGFSDEDIRQCEQTIKEFYLNRLKNSPSDSERQELETGATTIDVQMIKVADRRLEGFVKISINTQEAKKIGMNEITQKCEATMEMNSPHYIWQCNTAQ